MNKNKGFTLIELLVVIAIIGILSSVVLASLNTARAKGIDAAVKSNLANARAQAALFYDTTTAGNGTYTAVCTTATTGIGALVQAASTAAGTGTVITAGTLQTSATANCFSSATDWAAEVKLKASTNYFCVDATGYAKETATPLAASAVVCS